MDTQTEHSSGSLILSRPEMRPELQLWLVDELTILAVALGETVTPERLRIYAEDLCDIPQPKLAEAFRRARRESKFGFPKIADLRELAGCGPEQVEDVEARAAFDAAVEFADRHIGCIDGQYKPVYKWRGQAPPELSPRLKASVRHSGGWSAFKNRTDKSFPFLQKLFLENYQSCEAIEHKRTSLLPEKSDHECLADLAEAYKQLPEPQHSEAPGRPFLFAKRMPKTAPTEIELAARLELLRKQATEVAAKQNGEPTPAA